MEFEIIESLYEKGLLEEFDYAFIEYHMIIDNETMSRLKEKWEIVQFIDVWKEGNMSLGIFRKKNS